LTDDIILENQPELDEEEKFDNFQPFIEGLKKSKILLTTNLRPTPVTYEFLIDFKNSLPNSHYYPRKKYPLKDIAKIALDRDYTHMVCINERMKKPWSLTFCVLRTGPTLTFRLRKYVQSYEIFNKGNATGHNPEIILKNFNTALGRRVARNFATYYNCDPDFKGRTVVTFHN